MNASCFAFRDLNRNGIYDEGDRPMANVAFVGRNAKGWEQLMRSNICGFANYRMSVSKTEREIAETGLYTFELIIPPDWSVTTGNAVQSRRIRRFPGAPGDLIMEDLPQPIGLAPDLAIRGRIEDTGPSVLRVLAPNGEEAETVIDGPGSFSIPASPGEWQVEVEGMGHLSGRTVTVGPEAPVALGAMRSGRPTRAPAGLQRTLHFNDVISTSVKELPNGYGGLNWVNWVATHERTYNGEGYINGAMSGETVIYNSSGHPAAIWNDRPFDFVGGYFTAAWLTIEGEVLRIRAWRGEELIHQDALRLSAMGPIYFAADYRGVTRIDFATDHYWQVVVDDLTFRTGGYSVSM